MTTTADHTPADDQQELLRYVERFAMVLQESGIPRMAARVFAYVLADDAEKYTAAELARGLRVSPAAISGALRYLLQVRLLSKEREPGSRSDQYRIFDEDVWGTIFAHRLPLLDGYEAAAADGARMLPPGSAGERRMRESQEFFAFLRVEFGKLLEKWAEHRAQMFGADAPARSGSGDQ